MNTLPLIATAGHTAAEIVAMSLVPEGRDLDTLDWLSRSLLSMDADLIWSEWLRLAGQDDEAAWLLSRRVHRALDSERQRLADREAQTVLARRKG